VVGGLAGGLGGGKGVHMVCIACCAGQGKSGRVGGRVVGRSSHSRQLMVHNGAWQVLLWSGSAATSPLPALLTLLALLVAAGCRWGYLS
jgi:hypothetical protein